MIVVLALLVFNRCKKDSTPANPTSNEILIGALLPLSTYDENLLGKTAMEFAVNDFNALMATAGNPIRLRLALEGTDSDSAKTVETVTSLYNRGVRLLAGLPSSSMELGAIMTYINDHEMLMLNAYSTAPSLAIVGDNIFRLVTDDTKQSKAISKYLNFDGIEAVIVVWRNDNYGQGLSDTFIPDFEASGGNIINSVGYPVSTADFSSLAGNLNNQIILAKAQYGADKVGVCLFGFDESALMFEAALAQSDLATVQWYGCDGNAVLNDIATNPQTAGFAVQVNFTAPNVGIGTADFTPKNAAELSARIQQATGLQPNVNTLTAYDAVRIMGYCYLAADNLQISSMKNVLPQICASYNYLGISRELNDAGDLLNANYIFWRIEPVTGSTYDWNTYATYFADGEYIELKH